MKQCMKLLALVLSLTLLLAAAAGCAKGKEEPQPAETESPVETAEAAEETPAIERQHGERFEDVIMIEGMEETIKLEHFVNETAGLAMDYDYESFVCRASSDRLQIVSAYDDPETPENYIEVSYCPDDAETVADAIEKVLSADYAVSRDTAVLKSGVECIHMDASATPDGAYTADVLQAVYVIPADDGCRVAHLRYLPEGSDGFGRRLSYLASTVTVMDPQGERAMSDEQACAAIERYCCLSNPDLKGIVESGEYPVSWKITEYSEDQIVILFHSYTGADVRYYIDPVSGETYVTEFVSGVTAEEQRTDETLNVWDYMNWW